jgi:DNA polymerase III subunit epsilon
MPDAPLRPALLDEPMVFLDLETTGGSAAEHRITEIGLVEIDARGVTTWSTLLDPGQSIPPFIQQLTGITPAMVNGAPRFSEVAAALFERLEGKLLIAHNVSFDYGFLRAEFERAGYTFLPDLLCTVRLSRALFPREARHGLDALIARHALVPMARHRALADADLIWQFWRQLDQLLPADQVRAQIERLVRRQRLAARRMRPCTWAAACVCVSACARC